MALNPRMLLEPGAIRISRKGVDVTDPPDLTPQFLVMDSSWPSVQRLHTIAILKRTRLEPEENVNFDELDDFPLALMIRRTVGSTQTLDDETFQFKEPTTGHLFTFQGQYLDTIRKNRVVARSYRTRLSTFISGPAPSRSDFIILVFKP